MVDKKVIAFKVPTDTHKQMKIKTAELGMTIDGLFNNIIDAWLSGKVTVKVEVSDKEKKK